MTDNAGTDSAGNGSLGRTALTFSEAISRQPIRTWSILAFVICLLTLICDGMDAQLLGLVAPLVIEDFGVDRGEFGWALSAALVGFGIGSWGFGWLGDKIGRRWSLALATMVFSLATIGSAWSGDVWDMAAWRLLGGLGFGGAYSTAIALAGDWLPDRWRAVGVTTISVGTPAGGTVVSLIIPTLLQYYSWRETFIVVGGMAMLVVLLVIFALRESPQFLLARGRSQEAHKVAARVLDEPFELLPDSHAKAAKAGEDGLFTRANLRLIVGVGIAFGGAALVAYGMLNWGTTFLTAKGFSLDLAAYAVSVGGMTSIASSIAAGFIMQRIGSKRLFVILSAALVATLLVLMLRLEPMSAASSDADRWLIVALYGLAAAIFSCAVASMYAVMTHGYPTSCRAAGIGLGILISRAGAFSASKFGGDLIDMGQGSLIPFFSGLMVASLLVGMAAFVIDRHVPPAAKS